MSKTTKLETAVRKATYDVCDGCGRKATYDECDMTSLAARRMIDGIKAGNIMHVKRLLNYLTIEHLLDCMEYMDYKDRWYSNEVQGDKERLIYRAIGDIEYEWDVLKSDSYMVAILSCLTKLHLKEFLFMTDYKLNKVN